MPRRNRRKAFQSKDPVRRAAYEARKKDGKNTVSRFTSKMAGNTGRKNRRRSI